MLKLPCMHHKGRKNFIRSRLFDSFTKSQWFPCCICILVLSDNFLNYICGFTLQTKHPYYENGKWVCLQKMSDFKQNCDNVNAKGLVHIPFQTIVTGVLLQTTIILATTKKGPQFARMNKFGLSSTTIIFASAMPQFVQTHPMLHTVLLLIKGRIGK